MTAASLLRGCWTLLGRASDGLLHPTDCFVCALPIEPGGPPFCPACRDELSDAAGSPCLRCAMPMGPFADRRKGCSECRGKALGFDAAVALGPYLGPIRRSCLALKREPNAWMARWFADVLVESRGDAIRRALEGKPGLDPWVVPVPLHWRKRLSRGYNQAEALARGVASGLKMPVRLPLCRVVHTKELALAGHHERARRMKGVFRVKHRTKLEGRSIVLVDDILTSGATAGARGEGTQKGRGGAGRRGRDRPGRGKP